MFRGYVKLSQIERRRRSGLARDWSGATAGGYPVSSLPESAMLETKGGVCFDSDGRQHKGAGTMENTFFYTFSTIAQALAGALALLAAFVLFKLQNIDAELTEHAHDVIDLIPYDRAVQTLWDHYIQGRWDELLVAIPPDYPFADVPRIRVARLRVLVEDRKTLVKTLRCAVFLTLGTMMGAVFVLALVPASWSPWVARIGAVAFAICIVSYWPVIRELSK